MPEKIDTSEMLNLLKTAYITTGEPVEVDFRSLVDWVKIGDQYSHLLHPYPAKLLPHIANFFLRCSSLVGKEAMVLDPFCGSGTVALEAFLAGHTPLIADANPLALLIAKVKTTTFNETVLVQLAKSICCRAKSFRTAPTIHVINDHLWYSPRIKIALEKLVRAIRELPRNIEREFFELCLSVTARRLSFADPRISVPVRLRIKPSLGNVASKIISERLEWLQDVNVIAEFQKTVDTNIQRIQQTNRAANGCRARTKIVGSDARDLRESVSGTKLQDNCVDLVITSPPYGSAQKYVRASSLSLNWLGYASPDTLKHLERISIGREHVPASWQISNGSLSSSFENLLDRVGQKNRTRERITRTYLIELRQAMVEVARVTKDGGTIIVVVGNNQVCGETLRNDEYLKEVLTDLRFEITLHLIDHIKSRGLMTKRNKTASIISRESVLVFTKSLYRGS
ncbi:Putative RNA methylase family UPF0020 [Nitrosospira multiformis ATCC 25196]|nr:Putative RNA methylase family UPF0020 [Nitrosospira multiformis ATCC 25196]